jgi:hypothetical protein
MKQPTHGQECAQAVNFYLVLVFKEIKWWNTGYAALISGNEPEINNKICLFSFVIKYNSFAN